MSSQLREALSAVIDDEASLFETRRVLDEVDRDPELRERWHRYHLIGAALRREGEAMHHESSLARLRAALDEADRGTERIPESAAARRRRRGRATAVAVAASVALGVVVGLYPRGDDRDASVTGLESIGPSLTTLLGERVVPVATPADARLVRVLPSDSDVARMRAYMLHHAHHAALNQRPTSAVPFVKVAAFESR